MNIDPPTVILEEGPIPESEARPRSRTWPILPPPIETIHEHERDPEIAEPPIIEEDEAEEQACNEQQKHEPNPRKNSRKNAWGNLSYADLITRAIQSSPEQRLTLSQIYEWMVRNIPYFKDKGDSTSSAGWKNSIRHNLSLHSRFMRVQNDNNGKSSYWVINPDAKPGKASRRRSCSIDGQPKDKKRRPKKMHQSTDDIPALSPNGMKYKQNRSFDNLLNVASPCSSTDSLSNIDDYHNELIYPYGSEAFARPRSTSNVSNVSSISGRVTPTHLDDLDPNLVVSAGAEETAHRIETMSIDGHRTLASTINLNDSLKIMSGGNNMTHDLPPPRQHSDSFGSGDSGYESPAYFPPQQQQPQNVSMGNLLSPVPSKPPPPYTQSYSAQINRQSQQPIFNKRNYYSQQMPQQQQQANRMGRLSHPPMQSQPTFSQQQPQNMPFQQQSQPPQNHFMQQQMNQQARFDFLATTNANMVAPNVTMQQSQIRKTMSQNAFSGHNDVTMDIPDDLHQVKLFDFADQQQLASDLDAIIKNELRDNSRNLQGIYGQVSNSNDSNNNSNSLNIQTTNSFPLTGHNWVR